MPFRPIALLCLAGCALTAAFAPSRVAPRSTITMGPLDNLKSFKLPAKGASAPAPVEVKSAASKKTKTVAIKAKAAPKKVKAAPAPKASAAVAAPPKAKKAFSVPSFSLSAPSAPARRGPVRATNTKKGNFRQVGGAGYTIGDVSKLQATFCFVPQKEYLDSKPRVEFWEAIAERRAAIEEKLRQEAEFRAFKQRQKADALAKAQEEARLREERAQGVDPFVRGEWKTIEIDCDTQRNLGYFPRRPE